VVDPLAEKFVGLSPYNYALNSPLNGIDPDGMEAIPLTATDPEWVEVRPMDGQVTFEGYVGSDEGGSYSGTTKGNESKKKTESQIAKEKGDALYNSFQDAARGAVDGFGSGFDQSISFVKSLSTAEGWKDLGAGMAATANLACASCPTGVIMRN